MTALAWIKENMADGRWRWQHRPPVLIPLVVGCFKKTRHKNHKLFCSPCQEATVDGRKSGLWSQPDPVGHMGILTQSAFSPTFHFWKLPHFPNEAVPLPLRLLERMKSCVFASSGWRGRCSAHVFSFPVLCREHLWSTFCVPALVWTLSRKETTRFP